MLLRFSEWGEPQALVSDMALAVVLPRIGATRAGPAAGAAGVAGTAAPWVAAAAAAATGPYALERRVMVAGDCGAVGTPGYVCPAYFNTWEFCTKSDVYAFGEWRWGHDTANPDTWCIALTNFLHCVGICMAME